MHVHTYIHTYIYIYVWVYACICVCIYLCMYVINPSITNLLEKTPQSAKMNNFTGFGYQAFGSCPRGHLIFVRFLIDSGKRQRKFDSTVKHHLLVLNRQRRNFYSIQLQFLRSSKSVEASTRQPESHHRVVFVLVTDTLPRGCSGQSKDIFLFSVFF